MHLPAVVFVRIQIRYGFLCIKCLACAILPQDVHRGTCLFDDKRTDGEDARPIVLTAMCGHWAAVRVLKGDTIANAHRLFGSSSDECQLAEVRAEPEALGTLSSCSFCRIQLLFG